MKRRALQMNKSDLIDHVAAKVDVKKSDVAKVLEATIDGIAQTLKNGGDVRIAGLGAFEVQSRPAREARNPSTGQKVMVAASKKARFKAAKALNDALG
jgi:DNA-binding protein HU-beta